MTEYQLSYTASEIDKRLGLVVENKENINKVSESINTINENINTINGSIEGVNTELENKADAEHTHDYAETSHTHDNYADVNHAHDNYAELEHTHSNYAEENHMHSNYAEVEHNHDDKYDAIGSASEMLKESKDYTDTFASGKADLVHNHDESYDELGAANAALNSAKSYTDTAVSDLASNTVVDNKINTHNVATDSHSDIRLLIIDITNRLNALADSDDTTLDQMSEVVEYIKDNRDLIESVTTNKVNVDDIVNNLTTNVANKPLSAAQGVVIKGLIDALETEVDNKASASDLTTHTGNTTVHITSTERTNWNDANSKKHTHSNKTVLDNTTASFTTEEKNKLAGIAASANAYTHPSYTAKTGVPTANQTPGFGGTFTVSQPVSDATGHVTAINSRTITIPNAVATTSKAGLMSATDKTRLSSLNAEIVSSTEPSGQATGDYWMQSYT